MQFTRKQVMSHLRNSKYDAVPVVVVPGGHLPPHEVGKPWHYTTRGGKRIYYPSAYSKIGWSSMVYRESTRRVYVGELWAAD